MKITHNISALNTYRISTQQSVLTAKSLEKLSSGLRINRAGDDAAGLAISEKMRGQIRGLAQASRNIQDAVSLLQTAEGGLQEIQALLQRGRELAVQAANDTNMDADRAALQQEVLQINEEIDSISNRTEFNGMKLLRGGGTIIPPAGGGVAIPPATDAVIASRKALTEALIGYMLETSEAAVFKAYGVTPKPNTELTVSYVYQSPGGAVAWVSSGGFVGDPFPKTFSLVIDEADFLTDTPLWISKDRIIAHEMVHAMMASSGMRWMDNSIPKWFKEGSAEYLAGANERLNADLHWANGAANLIRAIDGPTNTSAFYSAGYAATKYLDQKLDDAGSTMKAFMGILASGQTFNEALNQLFGPSYGETAFMADFKANGAAFLSTPGILDGTGSILEKMDGRLYSDEEVIDDGENLLDESSHFRYKWDASTEKDSLSTPFIGYITATIQGNGRMSFQVGANSGQSIVAIMPTVTSDTLGVSQVNVKAFAPQSISLYDSAIQIVSAERSKFGAIQNRLEHALVLTDQYHEQLTNAESRIRDVDMAREVMQMTKQNILLQASQAMLANANRQPEGVLQLLR